MDVGPGPFLSNHREDVGAVCPLSQVENAQGPCPACTTEFALLENDQHQPGRKAMGRRVRGTRRVSPGEVFVVEVDRREVVVFEGRRACPRLRPDHLASFDARDVTWTEQHHRHGRRLGLTRARGDRQRRGERGAHRIGARAGSGLEQVGDPASKPGKERVRGD